MTCRSKNARGVTLIELLVVMLVLSIALSLVGPAVRAGYGNLLLKSTGRRLAAAFRAAENESRRRQQIVIGFYHDGRFEFHRDEGLILTIDIPASIQKSVAPIPGPFVFVPSGQILGPDRLELATDEGQKGELHVRSGVGRVRFVETPQ